MALGMEGLAHCSIFDQKVRSLPHDLIAILREIVMDALSDSYTECIHEWGYTMQYRTTGRM